MRMRVALTALFLTLSGTALAKDAAPGMQTVMADHVNPGALAFWAGGNDPPEGEKPADAKIRWSEAVKGSQAMQQWGARMTTGPYIRSGHWGKDAQYMVDLAKEGEVAAKAQNAEKAFEIGGRLFDACKNCHDAYVPKRTN